MTNSHLNCIIFQRWILHKSKQAQAYGLAKLFTLAFIGHTLCVPTYLHLRRCYKSFASLLHTCVVVTLQRHARAHIFCENIVSVNSNPICRNCHWQRMKFLSTIWHKMSATQPLTKQHPSTAQDGLSKWAVLRFETAKLHNLSRHLLTGLQIGKFVKNGSLFPVVWMKNHGNGTNLCPQIWHVCWENDICTYSPLFKIIHPMIDCWFFLQY